MQVLVGTTGWSNPIWNPGGFTWYKENSGLDAVELNMSFYQLPTKEQIIKWAEKTGDISWSVKVNRSVTHFFRFKGHAYDSWAAFADLFSSLDKHVSHYLFQLPPNAHPNIKNDIEEFFHKTNLGNRFALEWRNQKWFSPEHIKWAKDLGITIVSADSPTVPRDIMCTTDTVYLRLHGRSDWFQHYYSRKELSNIVKRVQATNCKKVVAFLNNEAFQLKNARMLKTIFSSGQ